MYTAINITMLISKKKRTSSLTYSARDYIYCNIY